MKNNTNIYNNNNNNNNNEKELRKDLNGLPITSSIYSLNPELSLSFKKINPQHLSSKFHQSFQQRKMLSISSKNSNLFNLKKFDSMKNENFQLNGTIITESSDRKWDDLSGLYVKDNNQNFKFPQPYFTSENKVLKNFKKNFQKKIINDNEELKKNLINTPENKQENILLNEELKKIEIFNKENSNFEKLKKDLIINNEKNIKKFNKLNQPSSKKEITEFVYNLINYINYCLTSKFNLNNTEKIELSKYKIKIQTRYNDFKNKGMLQEYLISNLIETQEEFIKYISNLYKKFKIEDKFIISEGYKFISKKRHRKKSLSEMKSITSSSSSYLE